MTEAEAIIQLSKSIDNVAIQLGFIGTWIMFMLFFKSFGCKCKDQK